MTESLKAIDLSFNYEPDRPVLAGLNFELWPGQVLGLAGANGGGKSTLVAILAGLLEPSSGELRLGESCGREASTRLRRESALMPQNVDHWLLGETGAEDLKLGINFKDPESSKLLENLICRWQLVDLLDRPVETLSLGQKKRISLAAALLRRPKAIFLDEPFSGLDWPGCQAMLQDLARLKKTGVLLILSTHDPALTWPLVDQWLLLKPGGQSLLGPDLRTHFEEFGIRPLSF